MRRAGAQWVRLHFRLNRKHRSWDPTLLRLFQQVVHNLEAESISVLGLVTYESLEGRQEDWIQNSAEVGGGSGDNPYLVRWTEEAFIPLLKRFPTVRAWEVWNEPNCWTQHAPGDAKALPGGYYLYPSNFAWLLRRAYVAARSMPHPPQVVAGGLLAADFTKDVDSNVAGPYLRAVFEAGRKSAGWDEIAQRYGGPPADHWGWHPYVAGGSWVPSGLLQSYTEAFARVVDGAVFGGRPWSIWITEIGWPTTQGGLSELGQAQNLAMAMNTLERAPRVGPVFWFKMRDEPSAELLFGLFRADGKPKRAWDVFRAYRSR